MRVTSWEKIEIRFSFFLFSLKENWNWYIKVVLVEILVVVIIGCFILYKLATMSPLGWHSPCLVDNADAVNL